MEVSKWMTAAEMREQIEKVLGADTRHEAPRLAEISVGDFEWILGIYYGDGDAA